jgi:hypothetical protein
LNLSVRRAKAKAVPLIDGRDAPEPILEVELTPTSSYKSLPRKFEHGSS